MSGWSAAVARTIVPAILAHLRVEPAAGLVDGLEDLRRSRRGGEIDESLDELALDAARHHEGAPARPAISGPST